MKMAELFGFGTNSGQFNSSHAAPTKLGFEAAAAVTCGKDSLLVIDSSKKLFLLAGGKVRQELGIYVKQADFSPYGYYLLSADGQLSLLTLSGQSHTLAQKVK